MSKPSQTLLAIALLAVASTAAGQSRVINVPHADIPEEPRASFLASVDHNGEPRGEVALSVGPLAQLSLGYLDWLGECVDCDDELASTNGRFALFAQFKAGIPHGMFVSGMPPLTLGLRKSFHGSAETQIDAAGLFGLTRVSFAGFDIGIGVELWAAEAGREGARATTSGVRPLASIEWRPPPYPKTKFVADMSWVPVAEDERAELRWLAAWGVEYDALPWLAPTLTVRHRESGAIGDSLVLIGVRVHDIPVGQGR